jgi:hypothetical protein
MISRLFSPHRLMVALLLLVMLFLPSFALLAMAADTATPAFDWHAYTWAGAIRTSGGDAKPLVGARFSIKVQLPAGFVGIARVDASRQQDGGGDVKLTDPNTFQSGEGYAGLYHDVAQGLGLAAIYGMAVPFEGGRLQVLERYPQTLVGAVRFEGGGVRAYVGAGRHDAAGAGLKAFASVEISTGGPTSTIVEVVQPNGYVRILAALRIK